MTSPAGMPDAAPVRVTDAGAGDAVALLQAASTCRTPPTTPPRRSPTTIYVITGPACLVVHTPRRCP